MHAYRLMVRAANGSQQSRIGCQPPLEAARDPQAHELCLLVSSAMLRSARVAALINPCCRVASADADVDTEAADDLKVHPNQRMILLWSADGVHSSMGSLRSGCESFPMCHVNLTVPEAGH